MVILTIRVQYNERISRVGRAARTAKNVIIFKRPCIVSLENAPCCSFSSWIYDKEWEEKYIFLK